MFHFFHTNKYVSLYTRVFSHLYEWLLFDLEEVFANVIQ